MMTVRGPDHTIIHSELTLGSGVIMVSSPKPEQNRVPPEAGGATSFALAVRVDDPDSHCARATAAGARIVREVQDEEYGSRGYMARDLEGNSWYFGTYRPGAYWDQDNGGGAAAE